MRRIDSLRASVDRHAIPFATTTMAKGLIDETHPLFARLHRTGDASDAAPVHPRARRSRRRASATTPWKWSTSVGRTMPRCCTSTAQRPDVDSSVRIEHSVIGDLDASIAALAALEPVFADDWLGGGTAERPDLTDRGSAPGVFQRALRPRRDVSLRTRHRRRATRSRLATASSPSTSARTPTRSQASGPAHSPRTFLITNGWSSMGFGLPAAIAAKLARPDLPVVCILGDGCFQMTCGELSVAQRERLAIPFVVLERRLAELDQGEAGTPARCRITPLRFPSMHRPRLRITSACPGRSARSGGSGTRARRMHCRRAARPSSKRSSIRRTIRRPSTTEAVLKRVCGLC